MNNPLYLGHLGHLRCPRKHYQSYIKRRALAQQWQVGQGVAKIEICSCALSMQNFKRLVDSELRDSTYRGFVQDLLVDSKKMQ
jgi:hypothetical protein